MATPIKHEPFLPMTPPTAAFDAFYQLQLYKKKALSAQATVVRLQDSINSLKLKTKRVDQLERKLQLILKHNTSLLQEVTQLSSVINSKNQRIAFLQNKMLTNNQHTAFKETRLAQQKALQHQDSLQARTFLQTQNQKLRGQILRLSKQLQQLQRAKGFEHQNLKRRLQNQRNNDLTFMRKDKELTNNSYQSQIIRLREVLRHKTQQLQNLSLRHLEDVNKLGQEIQYLRKTIEHRQHIKEAELRQLIDKYEHQIQTRLKQGVIKHDIDKAGYQKELIRLRADINGKTSQMIEMQNKIAGIMAIQDRQFGRLNQQKDRLRQQLENAVKRGLISIDNQVGKERQIARIELQNRDKHLRQKQALWLTENKKLKDLIEMRNQEINKLQNQLQHQRSLFNIQTDSHQKSLVQLNQRVNRILLTNDIDAQATRTNFLKLNQADSKVLVQQLQRMGAQLTGQLRRRQAQLQQRSQKLQAALKDKYMLRQAYENLLQKMRNIQQDYRHKLQENKMQQFDQQQILKGKVTVQLQNLKKQLQASLKQKAFLEQHRQKLTAVCQNKDLQIIALNQKFARVKASLEQQNKQLQIRLQEHQSLFMELDNLREQQIKNLNSALEKKERLTEEDRTEFQLKIQELKRMLDQLNKRAEEREKELRMTQSQKQNIQRKLVELQKQARVRLNLAQKVTQETLKEQSVQKENLRMIQQSSQNRLKQKYLQDIKKLERDLAQNMQIIAQLRQQILYWKQKCHQHQAKVQQMAESMQKMKSIQQKVMNLGLDKSILKNVQDMLKSKRY